MEIKAGWKTSEFWVTILCQIAGILTVTGVFTPDQASVVTDAVNQSPEIVSGCYQQVMGIVAMVGSAFGYSVSRGKVKGI